MMRTENMIRAIGLLRRMRSAATVGLAASVVVASAAVPAPAAGQAGFSTLPVADLPDGLSAMTSADFEGDERADVAYVSRFDGRVGLVTLGPEGLPILRAPIDAGLDRPAAIAAGDLDGDADEDLAVGSDAGVSWYRNDGTESGDVRWGPRMVVTDEPGAVSSLAIGDLDGNGEQDIVAGAVGGRLVWVANNGDGASWGAARDLAGDAGGRRSVVAGDLEGDGDLDLVSGEQDSGRVRAHRNAGDGTFTVEAVGTVRGVRQLLMSDLDLDRDLDVVSVGEGAGWHRFHGEEWKGARSITSTAVSAAALADLDRDTDDDLVFTGPNTSAYALNDRGPLNVVWSPEQPLGLAAGGSSVVAWDTVDENHKPAVRIVVGHAPGTMQQAISLEGSCVESAVKPLGALGLRSCPPFVYRARDFTRPDCGRSADDVTVADIDGDGAQDLVFAQNGLAWRRNEGARTSGGVRWSERRMLTAPEDRISIHRMQTGDLDGDGDTDVAYVGFRRVGWLRNDGAAGFSNRALIAARPSWMRALVLLDADGDRDPDLVAAGDDGAIVWYRNDGAASGELVWNARPQVGGGTGLSDLASADLDLDGDADLAVAATSGMGLRWYRNDGAGTWSTPRNISAQAMKSVDAVDVDGDASPDLVALELTSGANSAIFYRNAGPSTGGNREWVESVMAPSPSGNQLVAVTVADFDLDGDADPAVSGAGLRWLRTEPGALAFTEQGTIDDISPFKPFPADVDDDGRPDLVSSGFEYGCVYVSFANRAG